MNKWICINNNIVENVIVADAAFIQSDKDLLQKYQEIQNQDLLPDPKPVIGSVFSQGKWVIKQQTVIPGTDFSGQDLTGHDFSHQDLTGCKFVGCRVDKCKFEWVKPTFSLVGATWKGLQITKGPVMIDNPYYYTLLTDIVVFVSCSEAPAGLPLVSTPEEKNAYDTGKVGAPALWWESVKNIYVTQLNAWATP